MAKKLEDQEVKTAVLERIYKTTQKPVETLISSIDEQKSVINKLAERLDIQEKLILSMEESLKKQTSPAESFTKGVEELNARLSKLESGVIVQKTEGEKIDSSAKVQPEETEAPPEKVTEADGYIDIGGDFLIKNVKFKPFGSSTRISGEIMNKSDRGYGMIDFKVQAFDKENVFLGGHGFSVYSFKKGKTETFEEIITGVEPERIVKYSVSPSPLFFHFLFTILLYTEKKNLV